MDKRYKLFLPILFTVVLVLGMYLGTRFSAEMSNVSGKQLFIFKPSGSKIDNIIRLIDKKYVDTVDVYTLEDETIRDLMSRLDPHSTYIPVKDIQAVLEPLEGNFEGVGIEFYLLNDTIYVVSAISGGPSDMLGIRSGDKIIRIEDELVAGVNIKNSDVVKKLRGKSGTEVKVSIQRAGQESLIGYSIKRGKIPINSIDVAYMHSPGIGYIKVSNFGATTYDEFYEAIVKLKSEGLQSLILDLRGNPGGYLNTAIMIADEFLGEDKLIVYTEGKSFRRKDEFATAAGNFEQGKLIIMIDEGSASASEIVAGAVQDWDRGIILGRRSFGKGLVQEQSKFADGSALRLTTARYYTPTGRSIQRPYDMGNEKYREDIYNRYMHGEFMNADSIKRNDSLKYTTPSGKIVYGGGGISPDVFVPLDTTFYSNFYSELVSKGIFSDFIYTYINQKKDKLSNYKDVQGFIDDFNVNPAMLKDFLNFASAKGLKWTNKELSVSSKAIRIQLKALIARQLFKTEGYFRVIHQLDKPIEKAVELLSKEEK